MLVDDINKYSNEDILKAVYSLGIESLFGVSSARADEVPDYLPLLENYELWEILCILSDRPMLPD